MVKSGDAMRGVPALFFEGWGSRSAMMATASAGTVHAAGWMGEGLGANRGMAEVAGEVGGDILPAKAVPDGGAMEFRGGATYSDGIARRGGREGSR